MLACFRRDNSTTFGRNNPESSEDTNGIEVEILCSPYRAEVLLYIRKRIKGKQITFPIQQSALLMATADSHWHGL